MQNRSTVVTIIGWVFVVLSGLGILQCLMLLFTPMDKVLQQAQLTQPTGAPQLDPGLMASVMHGVFIFMFVVLLWVLLSSLGLAMRKGWARISFIVMLVLGIFWNLLYVLMGLAGRSASGLPGATPEMGAMMHGMMTVLAIMGAIFIVVFSWIIWLLTREKIKQEFLPQQKP